MRELVAQAIQLEVTVCFCVLGCPGRLADLFPCGDNARGVYRCSSRGTLIPTDRHKEVRTLVFGVTMTQCWREIQRGHGRVARENAGRLFVRLYDSDDAGSSGLHLPM